MDEQLAKAAADARLVWGVCRLGTAEEYRRFLAYAAVYDSLTAAERELFRGLVRSQDLRAGGKLWA